MGNPVGFGKAARLLWACLPLLAVGLLGCGGQAAGDVSGRVTFEGQPVVFGSVVIIGTDKQPRNGEIKPDGSFTVTGVPVGEAQVAVHSPDVTALPDKMTLKGKMKEGKKGDVDVELNKVPQAVRDKWFPIPERYSDHEKSGLTLTIKEGANEFPLKLTK